jgi:hypothetical protein
MGVRHDDLNAGLASFTLDLGALFIPEFAAWKVTGTVDRGRQLTHFGWRVEGLWNLRNGEATPIARCRSSLPASQGRAREPDWVRMEATLKDLSASG